MIKTIKIMGDPVLYTRAYEVDDPNTPEIQTLITDLTDTLNDQGGIGIAATQIGIPLRVIMIRIPSHRAKHGQCQSVPLTVFINPILTPVTSTIFLDNEGCFSIPSLMGQVPRYQHITYSAQTANGEPISGEAENLFARVLQHEVDHLDGKLYWYHIQDKTKFGFLGHIPDMQDPRRLK